MFYIKPSVVDNDQFLGIICTNIDENPKCTVTKLG